MTTTVIVVTYNSALLVARNITPLVRELPPSFKLVVVDNNSSDGVCDYLRHELPMARVIKNTENIGFARAVNQGLALTGGDNALLLNPDCRVLGADIVELDQLLQSNPNLGVVAPVIEHPTGRLEVVDGGSAPTLKAVAIHFLGLSRFFARWASEGYYHRRQAMDRPLHSVDWVSGACMLISRSTLTRIGPLSERWFMYAEDVEFCLRAGEAGLDAAIATAYSATHEIGASSQESRRKVRSDWILNIFELYVERYTPSRLRILLWKLIVCTGLAMRSAGFLSRAAIRHDAIWLNESRTFLVHAVRLALKRVPT